MAEESDPKRWSKSLFRDYRGGSCWIPPNSFVLGRSLEYFRIPADVIVICQGKSTYARAGVIVNVTPLEPEWEGFITLSLVNASRCTGQDICERGNRPAGFYPRGIGMQYSYSDRKGKYQAQQQIRLSSV